MLCDIYNDFNYVFMYFALQMMMMMMMKCMTQV
jgi:hypothetical protein